MIFLQSNAYMKRPVKPEDIKPRLLGTYAETDSPPSANNLYIYIKDVVSLTRGVDKATGAPVLV